MRWRDPARELEALRTLEAQRVDGIVLCSSRLSDDELSGLLTRLPAVVLVNRQATSGSLRSACIDDEAGAYQATQHLLDSGHRAIAFLAGPSTSHSGRRRALGYRRAMSGAGLAVDPELSRGMYAPPRRRVRGGLQVLATRPAVDAFLCYNDLVAVGALQACAACERRVPDDIAIVGCDDILLAALVTPPLTTVRSDRRALGAEAVRLLLRTLEGCTDGCDNVLLQPELVVRASAPAHAAAPVALRA